MSGVPQRARRLYDTKNFSGNYNLIGNEIFDKTK